MSIIKQNFFYQTIYQAVLLLTPLIVTPYISRVLGAEGLGIYSLTFSTASYFALFAMLGINNHGSRTIAAVYSDPEKLNKTFSNLLALHIIVSLAAVAAYAIFIIFSAGDYRIFFIAQLPIVVAALFNITWLFMGLENFKLVTIRNVIIKALSVTCIFIFVNDRGDLWIYLLIMSLSTLLRQLSVWLLIRRFVTLVKPSWSEAKPHIKPLLILFIPIVAMSAYNTLNRIMLGTMAGNVELGFFSSANRLITFAFGFIFALNSVMKSRIANLNAKGDETGTLKLTVISTKYIMLLAFALAFGIAAIANDFAPLFFGREFGGIGSLIMVLCIALPFMAFGNTLASQYVLPHSKDKVYSAAALIAGAVSIVANLIFIPRYGAMGAVLGLVVAEITRCIILAGASKKALPLWTFVRNSIFFLVGGGAMFFLVQLVGGLLAQPALSVIIQVGVGAIFYLGISAVYLYKSKDEVFCDWLKRLRKGERV